MLFCVGNHSARYLLRTIQWDIAYVFHDVHPKSSKTNRFFQGKVSHFLDSSWLVPHLTPVQVWGVESQHHRATQHGRPMFRQCGSQTAMGWDGNDRVSTSAWEKTGMGKHFPEYLRAWVQIGKRLVLNHWTIPFLTHTTTLGWQLISSSSV